MNFRGKLTQGGRVMLDPAVGTITGRTIPNGGPAEWSGTFSLPAGGYLLSGGYTLELDDGRSGGVMLASVGAGYSQPALVSFRGTGSLS